MRVHILSPDLNGRIDGALHGMLLRYFPEQYTKQTDADIVLVPITRLDDFKFNHALLQLHRPWVLLDYSETNWNYFDDPTAPTLVFGKNFWLDQPAWFAFGEWIRDNPPVVYFKRELLKRDVTDKLRPIDWPCHLEIPTPNTPDQFRARPYQVFFSWGYSHPSRASLHADIFRAMGNRGIDVCSDPDALPLFLERGGSSKWVSLYTPYYARRPMAQLFEIQRAAKISVSLAGAGQKCFRHAEACVGSVMAMQENELAWAYPWNTSNCLILGNDHAQHDLEIDLGNTDRLYEIYLAGQANAARYLSADYIRDYITPTIEAAL